MKYCKECGAANLNKVQECSDCGCTEFEFKCERCGTIFEDLDRCPKCGLGAGRRKQVCPECGEAYFSNACPNCGYTKVSSASKQKVTIVNKPNRISICGLIGTILGIVAIILNFFGFGIIFGIPAVVLGLIGLIRANKRNAKKGLAITALILGFVALLLYIITLAACKTVSDSLNNTSYSYTTTGTGGVSQSTKATFSPVDFPETVFVDDAYCTFTVNSIDPNNSGNYSIKVSITNKSDKNIMFSVRNPSLNGYSIDPLWSDKVLPGMTTNGTIKFSHSDIAKIGCDDVTSIIFNLYGYDSDTWMDTYVDKQIKIFPRGESAVKEYPRSDKETDMVLFDNDKCKMVVCGTGHTPILGYTLDVYLENKTTDTDMMFGVDSGAINGIMLDPFWACSVAAGKRAYSTISWFDSKLESSGITAINSVTLAIHVSNENDLFADRIVDDSFTLNFGNG